jgi:hypothetical protein
VNDGTSRGHPRTKGRNVQPTSCALIIASSRSTSAWLRSGTLIRTRKPSAKIRCRTSKWKET